MLTRTLSEKGNCTTCGTFCRCKVKVNQGCCTWMCPKCEKGKR